jgi:hypothetical protein
MTSASFLLAHLPLLKPTIKSDSEKQSHERKKKIIVELSEAGKNQQRNQSP